MDRKNRHDAVKALEKAGDDMKKKGVSLLPSKVCIGLKNRSPCGSSQKAHAHPVPNRICCHSRKARSTLLFRPRCRSCRSCVRTITGSLTVVPGWILGICAFEVSPLHSHT